MADLDAPSVIDTPASSRFPIYTRANAVDVWPGVLSPFNGTTQTSFEFERAWRRALFRFGAFTEDDFDEKIPEIMGNFYGYTYLNLSVQQVFGVRMPGLDPDTMTAAFLGSAEYAPAYTPHPSDENPACTARIGETIAWILGTASLPHLDSQRAGVRRFHAERPDLRSLSSTELLAYALPFVTEHFYPLIEEHLFITTAGSIPIGIVQATTAAIGRPELAMQILSGLGDVDSAAPTFAMWELSRTEGRDFDAKFEAFLDTYGFRCSNEWDLGEPDWALQPTLPLTMIERMRLQPDAAAPRAAAERLATERALAIEEAAALMTDGEARGAFLAAVDAAQVFLPARERTKATCVLLLQPARHALQELGRRLVDSGFFAAVDDFTLLTADELAALIEAPDRWSFLIEERRQWMAELNALEPPFVFTGRPPLPSTWAPRALREFEPAVAGEVLTGVTGCHGQATGIARVINTPADGADLQPGEVLVAEATDPGWTPLFVSATAVVVDTGAPLSHAAIVSRELGVPCVISAPNASRRIPDGARIAVDGSAGTVTVLSVP